MELLANGSTVLSEHSIEQYEPLIGGEAVERILEKAARLRGLRVVNVSSTHYGGGVAEILSTLTLLMNAAGIRTGWRVIQGRTDFFSFTKEIHNALQGADIELTEEKLAVYEEVIAENAARMHLDHDVVIVHDPQPLPLVRALPKAGAWIWCCHLDVSDPNPRLWQLLSSFVEQYNAVVFSMPEYAQALSVPQRFIMPAIDPFSITNREMSPDEIAERLEHYGIPTDLPLVAQISRFDKWKDPQGVIDAFCMACRKVDCRLVLLGNQATDDPEGKQVYEHVRGAADDRTLILSANDSLLVNALQRRADVILQKSIREGFGLTVSEAMWKGTPVIGGNVGGIRHQITEGENGFLVDSVDEAAERIVRLVRDRDLRAALGREAHETVRRRFLISRLMEDWLDLFASLPRDVKADGEFKA
jgi:trehalose synthase